MARRGAVCIVWSRVHILGVGFGDGSRRRPLSENQTVKEDSPDASYSKVVRDLAMHRFMLRTPIRRVSKSQENFRESPVEPSRLQRTSGKVLRILQGFRWRGICSPVQCSESSLKAF
jgi:hypothetical protein